MWEQPENDQFGFELYLAGERVAAGRYRESDSRRIVCLDDEGCLPGSLDGRVACCLRLAVALPPAAHDAMRAAAA